MKRKIFAISLLLGRSFGARWLLQQLNRGMRAVSSFTHHLQHLIEWGGKPTPEWYDHFLDQHCFWTKTGIAFPWERGIFSLLAMKQGAKVLELCCGDGFNAHHFYANRASNIIAMDFDPKAIQSAKRNFKRDNTHYVIGDIRTDVPDGTFDNVIWDAAIEHFTETEIDMLMHVIKQRLGEHGVLSGYTIVERESGLSHHDHEYEFHSKEDLLRFLTPHFKSVRIFETIYPSRHNLYFFASNGTALPFDADWQYQISKAA